MASLKLKHNESVFCIIRKKEVAWTPEEQVRQALLRYLIEHLQFPPSLVTVEKHLKEWGAEAPDRRLDILCFAKRSSGDLYPLLLVECKQYAPNESHIRQVRGYNYFINAPYIAVAGPDQLFFQEEGNSQTNYSFIPSYQQLLIRDY